MAKKLTKIQRLAAENEKLRRKLARYEKRNAKRPPKTGKRKVSKVRLKERRGGIKQFLETVKVGAEREGLAVKYRTHQNADNSIDGELRLKLGEDIDTEGLTGAEIAEARGGASDKELKKILIQLEDSADWNALGEDYWVMMGVNVGDTEVTNSPTIDRRPQRAWTNPVKGNRSGAAFMTLREIVTDNLQAFMGKNGSFSLVAIRLYWSPTGERPDRPRK
jgi:hypothetical protein